MSGQHLSDYGDTRDCLSIFIIINIGFYFQIREREKETFGKNEFLFY